MKTIMKYIYAALLLIGLGLTSCTNNEWTPGDPESKDCYNVYFPDQLVSGNLEVSPSDSFEFTVVVCRENPEGEVVVPLNIDINTDNKFTVSEVVFEDGLDEAEIVITLSDDVKVGETYDLSISVSDPRFVPQYTSDASKPIAHRISVTPVTWRSLGMVNYTDDIIYSALTGETATYQVELQVREDTVKDMDALLAAKEGNGEDADLAGIYRLVNPYNEGPFKGDTTIGKNTVSHKGEDTYLIINAENINQVYIPLNEIDLILNDGQATTYIYSLAGYELKEQGSNPLEMQSQLFGAIRNGSIVFDYDVLLYALSDRTENNYQYGNINYGFCVAISETQEDYKLNLPYFDDGDFTFTAVTSNKTFYSEARQEVRPGVVLEKGEPNITTNDVHREFYNNYGTLYRLVNPYDTENAGRPVPIYFCYKDGELVMHSNYQYQLTGHLAGGMYVYMVVDTEKSKFDPETGELELVAEFLGGDMYQIYFDYGSYREVLSAKAPDFMADNDLNFKTDFTYETVYAGEFNSKFNNGIHSAIFEKGTCNDPKKAEEFAKTYAAAYRVRNAYADGYDIYFCADKDGKVLLPKSIGMQKMGTSIFGVDIYVTIAGGKVDAQYGCFLDCLFTNINGYDVSAAYPASYNITTKESIWNYVWKELGTGSYRSMFHYDEIGVEVPDKGLKILKAEALNLYRVEDYLRSEGSDVDLEFYVDEVGTSAKATLNGIIDTKVKFASVDAESKYADFTFNIMDGYGYANDMYGAGMTWAEIEETLQIAQSGYSESSRELAFNLIYYVPSMGFYPNEGTLSAEILKLDKGFDLIPKEEEKEEEVEGDGTTTDPQMPEVAMSSISTDRFIKAVKREYTLGRAFVPVVPNNGGMANVEPQPYSRAKIAVK